MARTWAAVGLALVLQAVPGVVAGQSPAFHAELATSNTYYWRGIRRAGAGIEPAVALGLVKAPFSISVGGWAHRSFEDRHHSLDLDPDGLASAEESAWGSFDFAAPGWLITVGGIDTRYRPRGGPARQVGEIFGRIEWLSSLLSPSVAVWRGLNAARGTYIEARLQQIIANPLLGPGVNLVLGVRGGWAERTQVLLDPADTEIARNGVTHVAVNLALRASIPVWKIDARPSLEPVFQCTERLRGGFGHRGGCAARLELGLGVSAPMRRRP